MLVAKLFHENNGSSRFKRTARSSNVSSDNRFRESIGLITSGIRVVCNRDDGSIDSRSRLRFDERVQHATAKRNNCLRGGQRPLNLPRVAERSIGAMYASNFVSSDTLRRTVKKKICSRARSTRDRWKRKLRPNRAFVARSGRSARQSGAALRGARIGNRGESFNAAVAAAATVLRRARARNFSIRNFFNNIRIISLSLPLAVSLSLDGIAGRSLHPLASSTDRPGSG